MKNKISPDHVSDRQQKVHSETENFRTLFQGTEDGYVLCGTDLDNPDQLIYLGINPIFEQISGLKEEDISGKAVAETPSVISSVLCTLFDKTLVNEIPKSHEYFDDVSGKYYEIKISRSGLNNFIFVIQDISRQKLSVSSIRKEMGKYRLIADYTSDWEYFENTDGIISYISLSCERITGYKASELLSQPQLLEKMVLPEHHSLLKYHRDVVDRPDDFKEIHTADFQILTRNNELRWISHICSPVFSEEGTYLGRRGSNREMTERKQASLSLNKKNLNLKKTNDELDQAVYKAEKANRTKSIFLANMSHEIRTPMNAILGFAQVLIRDPDITSKQADSIKTIIRSGNHLLRLINGVLDMSKIEAGKIELVPTDFGLGDLLDDIELIFKSRALGKNLQLIFERDENIPIYIRADEGKLSQILINLLGNAIKFTEKGGVALRARGEQVFNSDGEKLDEVDIIFEVQDSGPGIPTGERQNIFLPFQQVENGGSAKGGTGLGLAISKKYAEIMGGSLSLLDEIEFGSCFNLKIKAIPLDKIQQKTKAKDHEIIGLETGFDPVKILVVDDIYENRKLLKELLLPIGFIVREACNGAEALKIFRQWGPNAVLMDMRMPVMDGYVATEKIKTLPQGKNTLVIALTASAFEDSKYEVMAAGVDEYIRKPFNPGELFKKLGQGLNLQYRYNHSSDTKEVYNKEQILSSLRSIPKTAILSMKKAISEGDIEYFKLLIEQLPDQYDSVADYLYELGDKYDYKKITLLLNSVENTYV